MLFLHGQQGSRVLLPRPSDVPGRSGCLPTQCEDNIEPRFWASWPPISQVAHLYQSVTTLGVMGSS